MSGSLGQVLCRCGHVFQPIGEQAVRHVICPACRTLNRAPVGPRRPPRKVGLISRLFVLFCWVVILGGLGYGGWLYKTGRLANLSLRSLLADRSRLTTEEILTRTGPSVALIRGRTGQGSGFVVRAGLVVTNLPWIANDPVASIDVSFPTAPPESRGPFPCKMVYRDKIRDLAFLSVESTMAPLLLDGSTDSRSGQEVVLIGSPGLDAKTPLNVAVSGVIGGRVGSGFQEYEKVSATITPENHGGPVVDRKGRVVGLVQVVSPVAKEGLCVPSAEILLAIDRRFTQAELASNDPTNGPGDRPTNAFKTPIPGSGDVFLAPPLVLTDASPEVKIAVCDYGKLLPADHPNVRAASALLDSAKLLFRQDESKIADLIIDLIARLRASGNASRASEALDALVECAPAPSAENPEERSDVVEYLVMYFQAKSQTKIQAEAILVMRETVAAMLKQRQKPVEEKSVPEKPVADKSAKVQTSVPVVVDPPAPAAPINNQAVVIPPQPPPKPQPILRVLKRKGSPTNVPVAFERESVLKVIAMANKEGNAKAEIYAQGVDFFSVKDGTHVEEVAEEQPDDLTSKIKIHEGPTEGRVGWVPKGFLQAPPNYAARWLEMAKKLEGKPSARTWYERILKEYPDSPEAKEAKTFLDVMPKSTAKP